MSNVVKMPQASGEKMADRNLSIREALNEALAEEM